MTNKDKKVSLELIEKSQDLSPGEKKDLLNKFLNQNVKKEWVKTHPLTKQEYIPVGRIEFLLTALFLEWWVEIKDTALMANSIVVTVRLHYVSPLDGKARWQDGVGASPLQTAKGAGSVDFNQLNSSAVQLAAPSAESFAVKDAAQKIGKIFGKDVGRKDTVEASEYSQMNQNRFADLQQKPAKTETKQKANKETGEVTEITADEFDPETEILV
jgi:hypothetical protein